jgi:hypothetical protein
MSGNHADACTVAVQNIKECERGERLTYTLVVLRMSLFLLRTTTTVILYHHHHEFNISNLWE